MLRLNNGIITVNLKLVIPLNLVSKYPRFFAATCWAGTWFGPWPSPLGDFPALGGKYLGTPDVNRVNLD